MKVTHLIQGTWLLLLLSCGPVDVVLADIPSQPDGGMEFRGPPCETNSNCMGDSFCEKPSCGASFGRCRRRPAFCPPDLSPECGCNGVTYWNGCLRAGSGIAASTAGECSAGATCDAQMCPDSRAFCARLVSEPSACSSPTAGRCWVVPDQCPAASATWSSCAGPQACTTLCGAIRSQQVFAQVNQCP